MLVIATYVCGPECESKMDTVVVQAEASEIPDIVSRLSRHSCYYQAHARGYEDLIVISEHGTICRIELTAEALNEDLGVLSAARFRELWDEAEAQLHDSSE